MRLKIDAKMIKDMASWTAYWQKSRITRFTWFFVQPILMVTAYAGLFLGVAALNFLPFKILRAIEVSPPSALYWCLAIGSIILFVAVSILFGFIFYKQLKKRCVDLEIFLSLCGLLFGEWVAIVILPHGWF
jgi:hypothetical protein